MYTFAIIGAGAWGTALAIHACRKGHSVALWAFDDGLAQAIQNHRYNDLYLPGVFIPSSVYVTHNIQEACAHAEIILFASPSHCMRSVAMHVAKAIPHQARIVVATKGLEEDTLLLMSQVLSEVMPAVKEENKAFVSGPSFAREVAQGEVTCVVVASTSAQTAQTVQRMLHTDRFRIYMSEDIVGVQLGGALKNIMAIAAGMSDGLYFGHNTRVSLINRGLIEMTRLGVALGADPLTFLGLSGMGDLVLTCTGELSRNRALGLHVAQGESAQDFLSKRASVAEGFATSRVAYQLAQACKVDMPVTRLVYHVLHQGVPVREAMQEYFKYTPTTECEGIQRNET